jgi:hypothetical protein
MVENSFYFQSDWVQKHGWVVVPIESASHIDEETAINLSSAFIEMGHETIYSIATEDVGEDYDCYEVPTSVKGLLEFSWKRCSFNYLLTSKDGSFGVLLTVEDYCLIGGSEAFVKKAIDNGIVEARREFLSFAQEGWDFAETRDFLTGVARRYETSGATRY